MSLSCNREIPEVKIPFIFLIDIMIICHIGGVLGGSHWGKRGGKTLLKYTRR